MQIVEFWEQAIEILLEGEEEVIETRVERSVRDLLTAQEIAYGPCGGGHDEAKGCGRVAWRFEHSFGGQAFRSVGLHSRVEVCNLCGCCYWNRRLWHQAVEQRVAVIRQFAVEVDEEEIDVNEGDYGLKEEKGTWIQGGGIARAFDPRKAEEILNGLSMATADDLIPEGTRQMLVAIGDTRYGDKSLMRGLVQDAKDGKDLPAEVIKLMSGTERRHWLKTKIRAELLARIANCQWLTAAELIQHGTGTRNEFRNLQRARAIEVYQAQLDYEEACYADGWLPDPVVFECYPEPLRRERLKCFDQAKHDPQYRLWKAPPPA